MSRHKKAPFKKFYKPVAYLGSTKKGDTRDMSPLHSGSGQVKEKNASRSTKKGLKFKKFWPAAPLNFYNFSF